MLTVQNVPTRFTFPSNKKLLKKRESLSLPQKGMTDTKIKKKTIHIISKSNTFNAQLRI